MKLWEQKSLLNGVSAKDMLVGSKKRSMLMRMHVDIGKKTTGSLSPACTVWGVWLY